jgi:PIN like domain
MAAKKKKLTTRSDTSLESLDLYTFFLDRASESKTLYQALTTKGAHVELHRDHFDQDEDDPVWLPVVCDRGWVIISHDQYNELEKQAIRNAGGRAFLIVGGDATGEQKAALVSGALPRMLRILNATPPPFVAKVYRSNRVIIVSSSK